MGKNKFYRNKSENKSKIFRRSIFVTKNIKKGEKFNITNNNQHLIFFVQIRDLICLNAPPLKHPIYLLII